MTDSVSRLRLALADQYTIERELGRGGMATVYLARDLKHDRPVALKVLRPELAAALGPERFLREIRTTAQLAHPHILPLHDSGSAAECLYYVMPFVDGESLRDRLTREKQLPLDAALQITREVADALGHAHTLGIVHRDIKPENILFQGGHAVVADFGIAKAVSAAGSATLTEVGLAIGTPTYMSPEQAAGHSELDGRSDLYSLGCVLYEMLSGETPFAGSTPMAILARKLSEPVPPLALASGAVPPGVEVALTRVLARDPANRFADAGEFAAALVAGTATTTRRPPRIRGRSFARLAFGAVVLVGIGIGAWMVRPPASAPGPADSRGAPPDAMTIAVLPFRVVGADPTGAAHDLAEHMGDWFEQRVSAEFGRRIAHVGSVFRQWQAAGGTLDSALSEAVELEVARAVGADRVVKGTIVVTGNSLVVTATMAAVSSGEVQATAGRIDGTTDGLQELVDQVVNQLVAQDAGVAPRRVSQFARHKPEAVQAYLAGRRGQTWAEQRRYYARALELDSSFALAAFAMYARGEGLAESLALRLAWDHRDRLPEETRAYLPVVGADLLAVGVQTVAARIEGYADLIRQRPDSKDMWWELAQNLSLFGPLTGEPDWRRRAQAAWQQYGGCCQRQSFVIPMLFLDNDTVAVAVELEPWVATRPQFPRRWPGIGMALDVAFHWYLALLRGDSTEAQRLLDADSIVGGELTSIALANGRGLAQIDRVIQKHDYPLPLWGWVRGRTDLWQGPWGDLAGGSSPLARSSARVYWTLLLGPSADTLAAADLQRLAAMARGDDRSQPSGDEQTVARCWVTLWRLSHGDTTGAADVIRYLDDGIARPFRFRGWALLLEAFRTELVGGDTRAAALRLDSVMRTVPMTTTLKYTLPFLGEHEITMPFAEIHNLYVARLLARHGEPERALAAVRRRDYLSLALALSLPEFLREEGRLAAKTGDTAGAIRAYRHYIALRENPDPPWRAQWDSVRSELAALSTR